MTTPIKTRVVQRSPDLGIGIRLKRIPEAVKQAIDPSPPVWWGWFDGNGERSTSLSILAAEFYQYGPPSPYGIGVWVAVVDNATTVRWEVSFTPKIWFKGDRKTAEVIWAGDPRTWSLPALLPKTPNVLFTPQNVTIPEHLKLDGVDKRFSSYWAVQNTNQIGREIPLPSVVAAGNTLTVAPDIRAMSGSLSATAFVDGGAVGAVWLDLMREVQKTWS